MVTEGARRVAAHVTLAALVGFGVWLAMAAATDDWIVDTSSASEPSWMHGPLGGLLPGLTDTTFSIALIGLTVSYVLVVAQGRQIGARAAAAATALLMVLFTAAPVVLSSDLFGYVAYARLGVHHINPYLHGAARLGRDHLLAFVYWRHQPTPYGPLFTLGSYSLGGAGLPTAVWAIKAVTGAAALGMLALVAAAARQLGRSESLAVLTVGANPLLLVYGIGGGHNDLIMGLGLAAALYFAARNAAKASASSLVAAVAVKASAGLLLPFALLASVDRRRWLVTATMAALAAIALTLAVFGAHVLGPVVHLATRSYFVAPWSGPDALGHLLGTGASKGVRLICGGLAGGALLVALWRQQRGADWHGMAAWAALASLCAVPSLVPWYVVWALPMAALAGGRSARLGALALTALMTATRLPLLGFEAY
jgi:hypothetical protein